MRQRFVWIAGRGLVEVDPDYRSPPRPFAIHSDTVEPFRSMADGQHYTSRSRYRAEVKARGLEEVGNERAAFDPVRPEPDSAGPDLARAFTEMGL